MTHSTAGGIIRSRLRRRSEGCFDWTTYLDVLIQLYYPLQLRKRTKLYCGTIVTALFGVFCGPRDFVVGHRIQLICRSLLVRLHTQSHGTGLSNLSGGSSTRGEHQRTMLPTFTYFPICLMQGPSLTQSLAPMYPI